MVSDWGISEEYVSTDESAYLGDAADPLRTWIKLGTRQDETRTMHQNRTVSYGLGDSHATVWSDPTQGLAGQTTFGTRTVAERKALEALLEHARTLVWREHPEDELDGVVKQPDTLWIAPSSPWSLARIVQAPYAWRDIPVAWVEQPVTLVGVSYAPVTHPVDWIS